MKESERPRPFNVLGTRVTALTLDGAVGLLADRIQSREPAYVCICPVHTIVEGVRREDVRRVVNRAWLATTDGMPLVWWGKLAGAGPLTRVYGPDLLQRTVADARHRKSRHLFYGGGPGVAEKLVASLRRLNPDLIVAGCMTPPFRPLSSEEEREAIRTINEANPDVVWVGLGCPKQELWMARFREHLDAPLLVGVGAAYDFLSGVKRQAPRWMQRSGLEWAFRLLTEPRRLWRRYLVYNSIFLVHALAQATGLARYPLEDVPDDGKTGRSA